MDRSDIPPDPKRPPSIRGRHQAFTLAELLIALAILGVIATFSIPKVLNTQQDSKKTAVLKEVISAISDITYNGVISGQLTPDTVTSYFAAKMNSVKACSTNVQTEGCWPASVPITRASDADEQGWVLHNGAWVGGIITDSPADNIEQFSVDWNGAAGPNVEGEDQIALAIIVATDPAGKVGTVIPEPGNATSTNFFNQIFAK